MRLAVASLAALLFLLALPGTGSAEIAQRGPLRVAFDGSLSPRALPRTGSVRVGVEVGGKISTTDGRTPPRLLRVSIAVNRHGRFDTGALPVCRIEQIQPATTAGALEACRSSLVGEGSFSARVLLPAQAPFPSVGKVYAFNGSFEGRPAILAHVYGTEPAPTSYALPLRINRIARGEFGTLLSASLPEVTSEWGYVTGLELKLGRGFSGGGKRDFVSARCPAPEGFPRAVYPLARVTFSFVGGLALRSTLNRSCRVRAG
jgi:hypothetical protein